MKGRKMNNWIGEKVLVTTDTWFYAPDGDNYLAVFGTLNGVYDSEKMLGVRTNRNSTNWYVSIGNMLIAGCQIHYAFRTDKVDFLPVKCEVDHEGKRHISMNGVTRIYNADQQ